jgi:hypothetical protein
MTPQQISDQAGFIYAACYEAIRVAPHGEGWDVFDGVDGPLVGTVDAAVLDDIEANYDMPVQLIDGSDWPGATAVGNRS